MLMNHITRLRTSARENDGFAMIFALVILLICTLLVAAAIRSSTEDVTLTRTYSNQQRAYDAALAGIDAYKYQLNTNTSFWESCPSTKKQEIAVPRSTKEVAEGALEETYEYETLPATGHSVSECETSKKLASIIDSAGSASGTFRIEATGIVKGSKCSREVNCERKIVATFDHPSFLDYAFVSNYELVDPKTVKKTAKECEHYYIERQKEGSTCVAFPWINGDAIEGPFHTNDASEISGQPTFGREGHKDPIEMVQGHYGEEPKINGVYIKGGEPLYPPTTGAELITEAETKYKGRTVIVLKEGTMEVKNGGVTKPSVAYPANGVIAVENGTAGCTVEYEPFFPNYETDTECGDVYVSGKYTKSLTIIAQNDVIINGNITTTGGEGGLEPTGASVLGLIADKYVRLYHPVGGGCESGVGGGCQTTESPAGSAEYTCNQENATATTDTATKELGGALSNPVIDAAILSTENSWGVDNFACGKSLGTIKIWGSIAEDWRGRVTCCASGGDYLKSYKWDTRLENDQPPDFLAPGIKSSWKIERETATLE
jgi:hypothetical protein